MDEFESNLGDTGLPSRLEPVNASASRSMLLVALSEVERRHILDAVGEASPPWAFRQVPGFLHAIGHLTEEGPVDVLIGAVTPGEEMLRPNVKALRQASPASRLIVYAQDQGQGGVGSLLEAGFDAVLSVDACREETRRALGDVCPVVAGSTSASAASSETDEAPPESTTPLGDVDLIEALLDGKRSIRAKALALVKQQSGIVTMQWSPQEDDIPAGHESVEIVYGQWHSGFLHAPPPVAVGALAAWAGWLGRWLAMEQHQRNLWRTAMRDELTEVWNRRYFDRFLKSVLQRAAEDRFNVTVMVFDIDDFKLYNDRFGHSAGDEILRDAARLMVTSVREHDVVARIGGDEFAVIFWDAEGPRRPDSHHPHDVVAAARRFQKAICEQDFPKLADARATLSVSGGLAGFPWDGRSAEELVEQADQMAMQSKRQGKNAFTFGPGAQRACQQYFDADR